MSLIFECSFYVEKCASWKKKKTQWKNNNKEYNAQKNRCEWFCILANFPPNLPLHPQYIKAINFMKLIWSLCYLHSHFQTTHFYCTQRFVKTARQGTIIARNVRGLLVWVNVLFMCPCGHLQPCYWAGCCHSRWSNLVQLRWRSDHIQWDTSPSGHYSCAGARTSCGLYPGHSRWNRSSYWCGSHTWQWEVERDRLKSPQVQFIYLSNGG